MTRTRQNMQYSRNPVYLMYAIVAAVFFLFLTFIVMGNPILAFEKNIFSLIFGLSDSLTGFFKFITQFGNLAIIPVIAVIFLLFRYPDRALRVVLAGGGAYIAALLIKPLVDRGRPEEILGITARETATGLGFPSGHAAVATAVGLVVALYVTKSWRRLIYLLIFLVCISRIYLGVHLPYDVLGGFLIGLFFYSIVNVLLGAPFFPLKPADLAKKLRHLGLNGLTLKSANVDARGSVPFFGEYSGDKIFVKVYNRENNVADWLFKLSRRLIYRRLEDEIPALTPKRGIEHEAYLTMLAQYKAGTRSSELIGTYHVGPNSYAMVTKLIDATGMDKMDPGEVTDAMLQAAWQQIKKLHDIHIVHRDLRCANVMIHDKTKEPWLIDFGFAESSSDSSQFYRDIVEFIASSSTVVGAKRAVAAANKILSKKRLQEAVVYMQYAALSGATTKALKSQKDLLNEIRSEMYIAIGISESDVKEAKLTRVSKSNIFQLIVILIFAAIIIPQINSLKESVSVLLTANVWIFLLACLISAVTYLWSAWSYKILSNIPVSLRKLYIVQWASSFVNRILPAGLGSLSLNTLFMIRSGHTEGGSGTIAATNNILGMVSSSLLLLYAFLGRSELFADSKINLTSGAIILWAVVLAAIILILGIVYKRSEKLRVKLKRWFQESKQSLRTYKDHPMTLLQALIAQLLVTVTYATVMLLSAHALGFDFNFAQSIFVVAAGVLVGSITPTPGGIGGAEAGLTIAITWLGTPLPSAIAIALLYRLATFWFTIPPGYAAYRYALNKRYFS